MEHYHAEPAHQGLGNERIVRRARQSLGPIRCRERLGGLGYGSTSNAASGSPPKARISAAPPSSLATSSVEQFPQADPDDLRRRPVQEASLVEVRVLGHDREAVIRGVGPDDPVVRGLETARAHMRRPWKGRRYLRHEAAREILVQ